MAAFVGLFGLVPVANATFVPIALPNAAYVGSTTLLPIPGPVGTQLTSLSDPNLTITFSSLLDVFSVADGSWGPWGTPPAVETSTPNVLSPDDFRNVTSVTFSFSTPLTVFGLEAEPDAFSQGFFPVSATFFNGASLLGTITNSLDGTTGALFAASSTTPITSVVLSIAGNGPDPAGTDPGIAQFRYALATPAAPEPATALVFGGGLALLIGLRRFRSVRS
jgi:hypothetical protein